MKSKIGASLFTGFEKVGGSLYFYDNEIIFTPHFFNIQKKTVSIFYVDILDVRKDFCGILTVYLIIRTKSDREYMFYTRKKDANEIIDFIKERII